MRALAEQVDSLPAVADRVGPPEEERVAETAVDRLGIVALTEPRGTRERRAKGWARRPSDSRRSGTPVHIEGLAGAEAGGVGREEEHCVADFFGLAEPSGGVHHADGL